jgi:exopolysaccharide biosynthesis polyprenyl glycosylphosphotransferase
MIRLFRVSIPTSILVLVLSDTVLIAGCYVFAMFLALNVLIDPWFYLRYENGWLQLTCVVAIIQIGFYMMDLYDDLRLRSRVLLIHKLCLLLGVSLLAQAVIGYTKTTVLQLPQWTMLYGSCFVLVAIPVWRVVFFGIVRRALPASRLLFVGMSSSAQETAEYLADRPDVGFEVIGYLDAAEMYQGLPYLGQPKDLSEVLQKQHLNVVVVDRNREDAAWLAGHVVLDLRSSGVKVEEAAQLYEMVFGRVSLRDLRPSQVLFAEEVGTRRMMLRLQTLYSLVLGCIGLVLCFPIMVLVFLLVKLTSPGPALYKQRRVGKNGATFFLYKFRSMYIDAEARTGPVWATKNDPRITPLGRWLRKLRLDELPQFINVIQGDMALVGPRPERPEFCEVLAKEIPYYHQRHLVKPGITGWAQINHKYTETIEDTTTKLEYDLYYVKHVAPALDAYIIFHTLKVMLLSRGAQ